MLVGSFPMSVDSKARVTLPATFRKEMTGEDNKTIYLVPMEGSVHGFTPKGFENWVDSLFAKKEGGFDSRDRDDVELMTYITSLAVSVDVDSAGRVALGKIDVSMPGYREQCGLTADVTIAGANDHFEVWNTAKWNERRSAVASRFEKLLFG